MSSFKDLVVWNKSMDFAVEMYAVTKSFPTNEQFGLTSQLRRASSSIALNSTDGWGRGTTYEVETCLILGNKLRFITTETVEQIGKMINGLIKSIELKIEV